MPKILDRVNSPDDLKRVPADELPALADEIRSLIIDVVSKNGGHLASNLGVVELTLALHYVFDSPRDKILWDVGHQCYTHKILTGRKDRFPTLRLAGGLLGFPDRKESEHDTYNTGHASTALSAAVGIAVARDRSREDFRVVAVVGDGGLTGGVAWEALNQIGHLREKIIIVLNYNEMSISTNVGAMSKYLSYLVSGQHYLRIKDRAKTLLKSIPRFGWPLIRAGRAVEDAIKKVFFPGLVFEELGIRYIGPVQGHSMPSLIEVFNEAKTYDGPVLIHCVTQKGRGLCPGPEQPRAVPRNGPLPQVDGRAAEGLVPADLFRGLRRGAPPAGAPGPQDRRHHRRHARRDRAELLRPGAPGPAVRRRHRRAARRELRRRAGPPRIQAGRGHLLNIYAAGL